MSLPATAKARWLTASLIRHLQSSIGGIAVEVGPLITPPPTLPAVIIQQVGTTAQEFLGLRSDPSGSERGALLTVRHWVAVVDQPETFHAASGSLLDRLRVALAVASIPWESEETIGITVFEGDLSLVMTAAKSLPDPQGHPEQLLAAQGWSYQAIGVDVTGFIRWTAGVTP